MYFALGFLSAALIAIAIGPAFWRRAVRLTKRRIEAATPVTLSEFRADKDKLRAEFAMALRKRDMRIETVRNQLVARVVELDAARTELAALKSERDEQYGAIEAFRLREDELTSRIRDLERDAVMLAARAREAEDLDEPDMLDAATAVSADALSGDYRADVEDLLTALNIERQRNGYLEEQARMLLARLESRKKAGLKDEAIAMLRDTLAAQTDPESESRVALRKAEARISGAETRLNALLAENGSDMDAAGQAPTQLLAEVFTQNEQEEKICASVTELQDAIAADWTTERFDAETLRERLRDIASDVSLLVYAGDAETEEPVTESLFDRVAKYAGDGAEAEHLPLQTVGMPSGPISDRMAAMRDRLAQ
ncbi:hypothetical protein DVH29_12490 [Pelagibacterium lacus]|uniref:Uncharacterized protein n=2 Tax=Pelagibacterium lacus TaxID=2282655 RepID=A0A369W0Q3_9HYPH|nr:hypothetical protein DVH29_12490 [Pelagibacterium lacus]